MQDLLRDEGRQRVVKQLNHGEDAEGERHRPRRVGGAAEQQRRDEKQRAQERDPGEADNVVADPARTQCGGAGDEAGEGCQPALGEAVGGRWRENGVDGGMHGHKSQTVRLTVYDTLLLVARPVKTRRPRGSLSRDQVIASALQLADQAGIDALSMPNLARALDCGVMTLYGYVDNKDDLLDAIAHRGLADLRLPRPLSREPAAVLLAWGRAMRDTLLAHPSLAPIFLSHVLIYTTGFVAWELPRVHLQSEAEYATAWRREFASLPPENFPLTAAVLAELPKLANTEQFEHGLTALVSGLIAVRTTRRGSVANRFRPSRRAATPSA